MPAAAGVGGIEARRRRRARGAGDLPRWLGAAAAVVLVVAVAAGLAAVRPEDSSSDLAESADSADTDSSGALAAEEPGEGGDSSAISPDTGLAEESEASEAPSAAGSPAVDLGTFASVDDLVSGVGGQLEARSAGSPGAADGAADAAAGANAFDRLPCDPPPAPLTDRMVVLLFGTAELAGEPVDVFVVNTPGERRVVALDRTCAVVADRRLP